MFTMRSLSGGSCSSAGFVPLHGALFFFPFAFLLLFCFSSSFSSSSSSSLQIAFHASGTLCISLPGAFSQSLVPYILSTSIYPSSNLPRAPLSHSNLARSRLPCPTSIRAQHKICSHVPPHILHNTASHSTHHPKTGNAHTLQSTFLSQSYCI
jgi:hypothetical protein